MILGETIHPMKVSLPLLGRLAALAASLVVTACGGGSTNPADASVDAPKEGGTVKDSGKDAPAVPDSSPGDAAPQPTIDPACTVPAGSPSGGACVADAGLPCNPVTNGGCNADAGEACDFSQQTGVQCYPPPPPNTQALCQPCDDQNTACVGGATCLPATNAAAGGSECAKFCCDDTDCTPGKCDKTTFQSDPLGFCVK
jgi:hypothetical protein